MKILLGSKSSVSAKNVDYQLRIDFQNTEMMFDEDVLYKIIDETEQFQLERNACTSYLTYGKVESFIDGALNFDSFKLSNANYSIQVGYVSHYVPETTSLVNFTLVSGTTINLASVTNILVDDVVLIYKDPNTFYFSKILDMSGNTVVLDLDPTVSISGYKLVPAVANYKRVYNAIETLKYIKLYPSSFSTNIFGDEITQFHTYKNINVSGLTDNFGLPITDLIYKFTLLSQTVTAYKNIANVIENDITIVDYIQFDLNNIAITQIDSLQHRFTNTVDFKYNPFLILPIRKFSNTVTTGSETTLFDYPGYALIFYSGDIMYKRYLDIGYFEESTNGVDYPFVNNHHYLYSDNKFVVRRVNGIADYSLASVNDTSSVDYNASAVNQLSDGRLC